MGNRQRGGGEYLAFPVTRGQHQRVNAGIGNALPEIGMQERDERAQSAVLGFFAQQAQRHVGGVQCCHRSAVRGGEQ